MPVIRKYETIYWSSPTGNLKINIFNLVCHDKNTAQSTELSGRNYRLYVHLCIYKNTFKTATTSPVLTVVLIFNEASSLTISSFYYN